MANFCTKCGKKLDKNAKCTCEKIKKDDKFINDWKIIMNQIKQFIDFPIDTLNNLNNYKSNNYLFIALTSLSFGIVKTLSSYRFYFSTFIKTSLVVFICLILFSYVLKMVEDLIYKKESDYNDKVTLVATSSIILLVANFVSFLVGFLSIALSYWIEMIGIALFVMYIYIGLYLNSKVDKNKIGYLFVTSVIISLLIIRIITRAF